MVRWCWVNFQGRGVLLIWMKVGQGPIVLAVGAGDSSPYIKEDIGGFMLWRPSCPPFCKHVTDMSEINFNMLNRFLDLKNLCVATRSMCLAYILKKILRILSFGGHLGHHLEYFNFPNDATFPMMPRWHHSVSMYGHIGEHIYAKTFCAV